MPDSLLGLLAIATGGGMAFFVVLALISTSRNCGGHTQPDQETP